MKGKFLGIIFATFLAAITLRQVRNYVSSRVYLLENCINFVIKNEDQTYKKEMEAARKMLLTQQLRKEALFKFCMKKPKSVINDNYKIYSDAAKLLYCFIPKVASTTWKRVFQVLIGNFTYEKISTVDKNEVHRLIYPMLKHHNGSEKQIREWGYYSFLITRHPFERLVATFRNKFEDPDTLYFNQAFGWDILRLSRKKLTREEFKKGVRITFQEFINYILKKKDFDEHWDLMTKLCSPCSHKYDYIGKMETLTEDSVAILKNANLNEKFYFPVNASDRYLSKSSDIMPKYFSNLTRTEIKQLYDLYQDDFLAFGYNPPVF